MDKVGAELSVYRHHPLDKQPVFLCELEMTDVALFETEEGTEQFIYSLAKYLQAKNIYLDTENLTILCHLIP